jgi:hypothetical protein
LRAAGAKLTRGRLERGEGNEELLVLSAPRHQRGQRLLNRHAPRRLAARGEDDLFLPVVVYAGAWIQTKPSPWLAMISPRVAARAFAAPAQFVGRVIDLSGDEVDYAGALAAYRAAFGKKPAHPPLAMAIIRLFNSPGHLGLGLDTAAAEKLHERDV